MHHSTGGATVYEWHCRSVPCARSALATPHAGSSSLTSALSPPCSRSCTVALVAAPFTYTGSRKTDQALQFWFPIRKVALRMTASSVEPPASPRENSATCTFVSPHEGSARSSAGSTTVAASPRSSCQKRAKVSAKFRPKWLKRQFEI